jgi:CheY-like chemotaxis protein
MGSILTIGPADRTQQTRQMLLESEGYSTRHVSSQDALPALRKEEFDVVILSTEVPDHIRQEVRALVADTTRVVQLGHFTRPEDLLGSVRRRGEMGQ